MFKSRMPGYRARKTQEPKTESTCESSATPSSMNDMMMNMANSWEDAIPGGRDFVRQLNRSKAEFFKGLAALINAEVEQAEQLDTMLGATDTSAKDKKPQKIKVE